MSNDAHDPVTLISYQGYSSSGHECGYCKTSGSCSFYLRADSISAHNYQLLLDRGWRRSGMVLYKPHMKITCCPHYTIRLDTQEFKPSRDQRQCLHRWLRYILGDIYIQEATMRFPKSKDAKKKQQSEFNLIECVHAPEYSEIENQTPPEPAHKFVVNLEPAGFTEEKYALFEHYQRNIHHEPGSKISRSGFKRFLCTSPLEITTTLSGTKLGSFHQCYRIDGRLVAMSVLDLLPHCVSGVYFIYHIDYAQWSLGKLSACREAALAKEGGYRYYYMGYYIHSCPKMRYKGEYAPSDLLDPMTYEWNPLDEDLKKLLAESKYVCPSDNRAHAQLGEKQVINEVFEDAAKDVGTRGAQNRAGVEEDEDDSDNEPDGNDTTDFVFGMPGVLTAQQIEEFGIGNLAVRVHNKQGLAKDIVDFEQRTRLHRIMREIVATVGIEFARDMVLGF